MDILDSLLKNHLSGTGVSGTSIAQAFQNAVENVNLNNIFMLVVTLYLSLKLIGMAYRTIMGFIWWGAILFIGVLGVWAYQQGVGTVAGTLWGIASAWFDQAEKVVDDSPYLKMGKQFLEQHSQGMYTDGRAF